MNGISLRDSILYRFASLLRDQADQDYISARSNYRLKLRQQFLWSALQSVEKYLKATLLYNQTSSITPTRIVREKRYRFVHDLESLLEEVNKIPDFPMILNAKDKGFLVRLSEQGKNRYIDKYSYVLGGDLHALDSLVWNVRRLCRDFVDSLGEPGKIETITGLRKIHIEAALDSRWDSQKHLYKLTDGILEKAIAADELNLQRQALHYANYHYFDQTGKVIKFTEWSSEEIPPHRRDYVGVDWDEIGKFVQIEKVNSP